MSVDQGGDVRHARGTEGGVGCGPAAGDAHGQRTLAIQASIATTRTLVR